MTVFNTEPDRDAQFACPECGHDGYVSTDAFVDHERVYKCSHCGFAFLNAARYTPAAGLRPSRRS